MAVERFAAAQDVEFHRFEVAEVGAVEHVVDVFQRRRFPDVHAHQHVAAANALLGGGAIGPHGRRPTIRPGSEFATGGIVVAEFVAASGRAVPTRHLRWRLRFAADRPAPNAV